jgi:hypothetical protein
MPFLYELAEYYSIPCLLWPNLRVNFQPLSCSYMPWPNSHSLIITLYDQCTHYGLFGTNTLPWTCSVTDIIEKPAYKHLYKTYAKYLLYMFRQQSQRSEILKWMAIPYTAQLSTMQHEYLTTVQWYCGVQPVQWQVKAPMLIMTRENCSCEHRHHRFGRWMWKWCGKS